MNQHGVAFSKTLGNELQSGVNHVVWKVHGAVCIHHVQCQFVILDSNPVFSRGSVFYVFKPRVTCAMQNRACEFIDTRCRADEQTFMHHLAHLKFAIASINLVHCASESRISGLSRINFWTNARATSMWSGLP